MVSAAPRDGEPVPCPVLYSFRRCPYAMRSRMGLLISGIACELREVRLADKPKAMLYASPKATVPVLVVCEGHVIDESLDIMRWALAQNDPEDWLGLSDEADSLIARNDGAFKHHLDRYKYATRHGSDAEEHRASAVEILANLDRRISVNGSLLRRERSLADMAIMPFIRQFAETDRIFFDGLPLPAIQGWLEYHLGSPLFEATMIRPSPWHPGEAPVMFGRALYDEE